jgi:hypothetical protein
LHVSTGVENPDDLERLRLVTIDDQVGVDEKKAVPFVGEVLAPVA